MAWTRPKQRRALQRAQSTATLLAKQAWVPPWQRNSLTQIRQQVHVLCSMPLEGPIADQLILDARQHREAREAILQRWAERIVAVLCPDLEDPCNSGGKVGMHDTT
jgi:phosphomevalonate kinase